MTMISEISEVCHTSLSGGRKLIVLYERGGGGGNLDGSHLHEPRKDFPAFGIHTMAVEKMWRRLRRHN